MRRWALLGFLVAVLLLASWWFLLISPRNGRIDEAHRQLEAAQTQELTLKAQIVDLQKTKDSEAEYQAAIAELGVLIPELPVLEDFFDQIYELSLSSGVKLLSMSPAPPIGIANSELREISVPTTVEGGFFEILGFLFGLSDMDRLVRVDGVSVAANQNELGQTVLTVSLDLRLFTLTDLLPLPELPSEEMPAGGTSSTLPGGGVETTVSTSTTEGG